MSDFPIAAPGYRTMTTFPDLRVQTALMLCCPMTTKVKGYPFEVILSGSRRSAVLADQVKSLDWVWRKAKYKGKARLAELASVRAKIMALVGS